MRRPTDTPDYAIQTQQLVKVYKTAAGDFTALKGIDLQVGHGEFAAVYGKSGAGKSTMINLITGIDSPTSGEIVVNGTRHAPAARRSTLALARPQPGRRLSVLSTAALAHVDREHHAGHGFQQHLSAARAQRARLAIARSRWASPSTLTKSRRAFPAGSSSAWRSRARWRTIRPSSWPTSRRAISIRAPRTKSSICFPSLVEHGKTLLVVTHDKEIAVARPARHRNGRRADCQIAIAQVHVPDTSAPPEHSRNIWNQHPLDQNLQRHLGSQNPIAAGDPVDRRGRGRRRA